MYIDQEKNHIKRKIAISDQDIEAYIDDELSCEDCKHIQNIMAYDPTSQKRCDEIKSQKKLLKLYWDSLSDKEKSELL
ncbi:MAG: hypothetical protein AAF549_09455 [Pseudomonadota bacterium]